MALSRTKVVDHAYVHHQDQAGVVGPQAERARLLVRRRHDAEDLRADESGRRGPHRRRSESPQEELMASVRKRVGRRFVNVGGAMWLVLAFAAMGTGAAQAQSGAEPAATAKSVGKSEPKVESKPAPTNGEKSPVKQNVKQLGREAS